MIRSSKAFQVLIFSVWVVLSSHTNAFSQVTIYDLNPVESVSARAAVLGDGYVADAYDATVLFRNPGALAMLPEFSFVGGYSAGWENNSIGQNAVVAIPLSGIGVVALGLSMNRMGFTKNDPTNPIAVRLIQYLVDLGYGYRITRTVGIGARVGLRYSESLPSRLGEFSPAVGLYYDPSPQVSYGLVYYEYGSLLSYVDNVDSLGKSFGVWRSNEPRRSLQLGLTLHLRLWSRDPVLTLALVNEKILRTQGLSYKGGLEVRPIRFIALRAGYFVEPNVAYGIYGAGFSIRWVEIDWVISPSQLSNRFHQVTFVIRF